MSSVCEENKHITINIQLFAEDKGDKTEKATPRKRREARKKGQVLQSRELTSAIVLLFVFISIRVMAGFMWGQISNYTTYVITNYTDTVDYFVPSLILKLFLETAVLFMKVLSPVFIIAIIAGVVASYAQVGFLLTGETLAFKFNRINPLSGMKRIFSIKGLVELVKAMVKILIISYIAYSYLNGETVSIIKTMGMDAANIAKFIGEITMGIAVRICGALIILGALDYFYQWWEYEKSLKMSKQEVKEEYKQIEGNPEVRQRMKQKRRQISMSRMLHEVPKADVVITNPTHFAVALKYDGENDGAPVVAGKGIDYLALRIRELAKETGVPVIENKQLARTLYDTVEIGDVIPEELYQAVAEILAYVYSLKAQ